MNLKSRIEYRLHLLAQVIEGIEGTPAFKSAKKQLELGHEKLSVNALKVVWARLSPDQKQHVKALMMEGAV